MPVLQLLTVATKVCRTWAPFTVANLWASIDRYFFCSGAQIPCLPQFQWVPVPKQQEYPCLMPVATTMPLPPPICTLSPSHYEVQFLSWSWPEVQALSVRQWALFSWSGCLPGVYSCNLLAKSIWAWIALKKSRFMMASAVSELTTTTSISLFPPPRTHALP